MPSEYRLFVALVMGTLILSIALVIFTAIAPSAARFGGG
jgi:hypothetical protein